MPFAIAVFACLLYGVWIILDLPPEQRVIEIAREYFSRFGLAIIIVSSFIEGLLIAGLYFPGSIVFFLGLIVASDDVGQVAKVAVFAIIGIWTAYVANFYIGRFGWYRILIAFGLQEPLDNAKGKLERHGLSAIAMTFWHPNIGAVVSTAAGVLQFRARAFLPASFLAVAFWLSCWSILVFWLGPNAISILGFRVLIILLLIWMTYRFLMARYRPGVRD
ncbi:hypothetical protein HMPREF9696_04037 [Afipia clevelandensis ATCC 49720]|uniref:Membrane-associated protein n=1 Tax=Afipia clevelandensis ATCC 49720 TaxID=883079 RepID=K8NRT9_9BRAD|nr:hypothetical protein HMPREF9696_04037 [Afipia clevelandensis ATCC 49720]